MALNREQFDDDERDASAARFAWSTLHGGAAFADDCEQVPVQCDGSDLPLADRVVDAVRRRHPHLDVVCDDVEVVPGVRMLGIAGGTQQERDDAARFARRFVACLLYRRSR